MNWIRFSILLLVASGAGFGLGLFVFPPAERPASNPGAEESSRRREASPEPAPPSSQASSPPAPRSVWDAKLGAPPVFTDVTAESGVDFRHENGAEGLCLYPEIMGSGLASFDYDGDGDLDLYFVNGNHLRGEPDPSVTNRLYENTGGFRFRDITAKAGVGHAGFGCGAATGDYDGDGDLDLYVSNVGPNVLYRNNGDGTFTDVTSEAGVGDSGWGETCAFFDADSDGDLDLYVQNYLTYDASITPDVWVTVGGKRVRDYPAPLGYRGAADRLFRNDGNGKFTDVTDRAGIGRPDGKGMGTGCFDYDGDGDFDIFVANDSAENFLFRNRGDGTFEDVGLIAGVAFSGNGVPEASMGVDVGDFDNDGRADLIVPCLHRQVYTLYRNLGDRFEDVSDKAGLAPATAHATGFNANFLDYDQDGDLDIFFTNGGVRMDELLDSEASYEVRYGIADTLVANDGKGRFVDVSAQAGPYFSRALIGRGSVAADLDGDGDLDLAISNLAGPAVLLRNDTPGGHGILLDLVPTVPSHSLGARVRVEAGGRTWMRATHAAVTFLSQGDRRLHFGIGASDRVDRIEVIWPGGKKTELESVPAGGVVRAVEE